MVDDVVDGCTLQRTTKKWIIFEAFENKVLGPKGTVRSPRHYILIYRWYFVVCRYMNHILNFWRVFCCNVSFGPLEHSGGTRQKISQLGSLRFKAPLNMSNWVVFLMVV